MQLGDNLDTLNKRLHRIKNSRLHEKKNSRTKYLILFIDIILAVGKVQIFIMKLLIYDLLRQTSDNIHKIANKQYMSQEIARELSLRIFASTRS